MSNRLMATATLRGSEKNAFDFLLGGLKGPALKMMATYAGIGTAIKATDAGIDYGLSAFKKNRQRAKMAPLYEEMIRLHPKLKDFNPERVKLYYEQLWHFSPKVAENPLAAGNHLYTSLQYDVTTGGPGIATFGELVKIEESVSKAKGRGSDIGQTMMTGAQLYGGAMSAAGDQETADLKLKALRHTTPLAMETETLRLDALRQSNPIDAETRKLTLEAYKRNQTLTEQRAALQDYVSQQVAPYTVGIASQNYADAMMTNKLVNNPLYNKNDGNSLEEPMIPLIDDYGIDARTGLPAVSPILRSY
jgi:hypothetical protein